jgi:hypothetical protein
VHSDDNVTEYGRINIEFLSNGTVVHNIQMEQGSVSDHEVILNIRLTFADVLTLYASRRFKIEAQEIDVTTRLTPLQPNSHRSNPVVDGYFVGKPKPLDFTCTELDLSDMLNRKKHAMLSAVAHAHLQKRAYCSPLSLLAALTRIPA